MPGKKNHFKVVSKLDQLRVSSCWPELFAWSGRELLDRPGSASCWRQIEWEEQQGGDAFIMEHWPETAFSFFWPQAHSVTLADPPILKAKQFSCRILVVSAGVRWEFLLFLNGTRAEEVSSSPFQSCLKSAPCK